MNIPLKKTAVSFVVFLMATGLSVTSSFAAAAKLPPGCNPEIHKIQTEHSSAKRVENKGYTHQYVKKNDPSLGTTCFDQAMGLTSRLGDIFSDRVPTNPPPPDSSVFENIAYPDWAATSLLATDLNSVITPTLNSVLSNFSGTVTEPLGTTSGDSLDSFVGSLSSILQSILSGQSSILSTFSKITSSISSIDAVISSLGVTDPFGVSATIGTLNDLLSDLSGLMKDAESLLNSALSGPLGTLQSTIMGPATSMDCDRMGTWWSGSNSAPPGFEPIEASGIEMGIPYMPIEDLFASDVNGMATDFLSQVNSSTGSAALSAALANLTGPLSAPGTLDSWKTPPLLPPGTDTASIISGM